MKDIQWRKWSDAAFDESRVTGKPVLLSISAVWCHWCHVMDETTYSNPTVVEMINEHFVPVRVDNDRNPDINERYNMGGWPTTAFLTHDRDVIAGATYVPPDQMAGILHRVTTAYAGERDALIAQARGARLEGQERVAGGEPGVVDVTDVLSVVASVRSGHDREHGGFGFDQKFPFPDALALLLLNYEHFGDERDLRLVTHTLDSMLGGDIFDRIDGGMFRYATRRDWTEPHYEKMLSDNARIASVLLDAYRVTGKEDYLDAASGIFRYAENTLRDEQSGLLLGSQDAGEDYYKADAAGRRSMEAPRVDTAAYVDSNCVMARAYLRLWAVAGDHGARDMALSIIGYLNDLSRGDDGTVPHYIENGTPHEWGILADHAGLMLADVECFEATGQRLFLENARDLAARLDSFAAESGAFHDITRSRAASRGLDRYAIPIDADSALATALGKLASLTGETSYADRARLVMEVLAGQYEDYGILASGFAIAAAASIREPVVVTVRAGAGDPKRDRMLQASMSVCDSACTVKPEEPEEGEDSAAVICVGTNCLGRITDPDALPGQLAAAVRGHI